MMWIGKTKISANYLLFPIKVQATVDCDDAAAATAAAATTATTVPTTSWLSSEAAGNEATDELWRSGLQTDAASSSVPAGRHGSARQ